VNEKELNIYKYKSLLQENFLVHIIHYTLYIFLFILISACTDSTSTQKRNQISKNNEQLIPPEADKNV